jgi:hypothetical protein
MAFAEDEVSNSWQQPWQNLWRKLFKAAWALGIILFCVVVVEGALVFCLITVGTNQEALITNQKAIASNTNQLIQETLVTIHQINTEIGRQYDLLVKTREKSRQQFEAQQVELSSYKTALAEIVASDRELVAKQVEILQSTREAANAARSAATSTRNTNRTITEKVVTSDDKQKADKQNAKLLTKTQAVDASQKKLNTLVHQYKHAIKKVEHP